MPRFPLRRIHTSRTRIFALSLVLILAATIATATALAHPVADPKHENTYAKDFVMDAPWRVIDAQTAIPLTIILKDCDVLEIQRLYRIRCWDVTGGGSTILWNHDFGEERIGNDASEHNYWTYITTVAEGHPTLPNGTLLTPANLGYGAGQNIDLKVTINYRDLWIDQSETRYLRVRVGGGPFPWPDDWYGGDTHYHTMYTNNIAEFGAPLPAVSLTAEAVGLHWLTATDHSCDLDETGDGPFSYATLHWEYTLQSPAGSQTVYRNVFAYGSSWGSLGADIAELDSPDLRLYRGVEINLASVDADSYDKTLHCLFYNPAYIHSPYCGAIGERPVSPSLPSGLDQLAPEGFAYAAHPQDDLGGEWGGIDFTVNGARWGDEDYATALLRESFRGLEAFNTRQRLQSNDQENPWSDFDAGHLADDPYPDGLLAGVSIWDDLLRAGLGAPSRKIFLAGGSDAHGDFNYATYLGLDSYATDNAIGKVQTVVRVPGGYGPGNLPPMAEILAAYRSGCSVATDGPFVEIGIDGDGDDDWYGPQDLKIGDDGVLSPDACPPLDLRWRSLPEFGAVSSLRLFVGSPGGTTLLMESDPSTSGQGFDGATEFPLAGLGLAGPVYLRAEVQTADGGAGHRAYTNPIWITFDPTLETAQGDPLPEGPRLLGNVPNPFNPRTEIRFELPSTQWITLAVFDVAGRPVRTLVDDGFFPAGQRHVVWDGLDDKGVAVPSGVYFARLVADGIGIYGRMVLVR